MNEKNFASVAGNRTRYTVYFLQSTVYTYAESQKQFRKYEEKISKWTWYLHSSYVLSFGAATNGFCTHSTARRLPNKKCKYVFFCRVFLFIVIVLVLTYECQSHPAASTSNMYLALNKEVVELVLMFFVLFESAFSQSDINLCALLFDLSTCQRE